MSSIVMMWSVLFSQVLRMFYAYDVGRHLRVTPIMATLNITTIWLPSEPATFLECRRLLPSIGGTTHDGCHLSAARKKAAIGAILRYCEDWLEWRLALLSHRCGSDLYFLGHSLSRLPDDPPSLSEIKTSNPLLKPTRCCLVAPTRTSIVSSGHEPAGPLSLETGVPCVNLAGTNNFGFEDIKFGTRSPTSNSEAIQDRLAPPTKRNKTEPETTRKFACPFFKHDPEKYRKFKPCAWTGWSSVHRVKEHLYRKHTMPKHACERCRLDLGSAVHLSAHRRMETPCTLAVGELQAEIDQAQFEALRCRKRAHGKREMTENEKWDRVYTILFPNDRSIPSPFHDDSDYYHTETRPKFEDECYNMLDNFGEYFRRELPEVLKPRLEQMLSDGDPVGDRIVDLLQEVVQNMLRSFRETGVGAGIATSRRQPVTARAKGRLEFASSSTGFGRGDSVDPSSRRGQEQRVASQNPAQEDAIAMFHDSVVDSLQDFDFPMDDIFNMPLHVGDQPFFVNSANEAINSSATNSYDEPE